MVTYLDNKGGEIPPPVGYYNPALRILPVSESLKVRIRNAMVEGFLTFIRWGVPCTLLLLCWGWLAQDYYKVRIQASRGNAVFEMVQAQQRAQQQGQGGGK